jgi:hypothetical protein
MDCHSSDASLLHRGDRLGGSSPSIRTPRLDLAENDKTTTSRDDVDLAQVAPEVSLDYLQTGSAKGFASHRFSSRTEDPSRAHARKFRKRVRLKG